MCHTLVAELYSLKRLLGGRESVSHEALREHILFQHINWPNLTAKNSTSAGNISCVTPNATGHLTHDAWTFLEMFSTGTLKDQQLPAA